MTELKAPRCGYPFPLLAGLMLFASGCSLLTVQGPPAGHQMLESFECTESTGPPMLDLGLAVLGGVGIVAGAQAEGGDDWPWVGYFWGGAATFSLGTWSAVAGFRRTSRCRDAKRALQGRLDTPESHLSPRAPGSPDAGSPEERGTRHIWRAPGGSEVGEVSPKGFAAPTPAYMTRIREPRRQR